MASTHTVTSSGAARPRGIPASWLSWARKCSLAFVDQALISGSNFILSVLLARWLVPAQYGAYALAFSIFIFLSLLHQALLLEPMSVLGPSRYPTRRREYLGALLQLYAAAALPIAVILGLSALAAPHLALPDGLRGALAGLSLAAPCVLLFWFARRAFYLELAPARAAVGAFLYCVLLLGGLVAVYRYRLLSPFVAYLLMALAALVVGALLLARARPVTTLRVKPVWQEHWTYGRWALPAYACAWLPENILYLLTAFYLSMGEVGALKAVLNIILPVSNSAIALSLLFLPYMSGVHRERGPEGVKASIHKVTLLYVGGGLTYWALASVFREPLFQFLYRGKFMAFSYLVPWMCVAAVVAITGHASLVGLRAMESPSAVFVANCFAGGVAVVVGFLTIPHFGLKGAVATYGSAHLARLVAARILLNRKIRSVAAPLGVVECPLPQSPGD